MSNVGHYGLLIRDPSKQRMHQIMEDYAIQQLTAEREKAAKLVEALEMAITVIEDIPGSNHTHSFTLRHLKQSLTEYKKQ
jgi:hypothetical protein